MNYPTGIPRPRGFWNKAMDRRRYGHRAPLQRELIHVDPDTIVGERKTDVAAKFHRAHGAMRSLVRGGDWDLAMKEVNLRALGVYLSCHARWIDGASWEDTYVYTSYRRKIDAGTPHPDCPTLAALDARYAALDAIYEQVRDTGVMSEETEDLVTINLDRHGRAFWGPNGRHRVCIALVLGLRRMPARVGIVHEDALDLYQDLRCGKRARLRSPWGMLR